MRTEPQATAIFVLLAFGLSSAFGWTPGASDDDARLRNANSSCGQATNNLSLPISNPTSVDSAAPDTMQNNHFSLDTFNVRNISLVANKDQTRHEITSNERFHQKGFNDSSETVHNVSDKHGSGASGDASGEKFGRKMMRVFALPLMVMAVAIVHFVTDLHHRIRIRKQQEQEQELQALDKQAEQAEQGELKDRADEQETEDSDQLIPEQPALW